VIRQPSSPDSQSRLSKAFTSFTQVIIKIANEQMGDIHSGKLAIGFGEFQGPRGLKHFKIYQEQFLLFVIHVRGILRVK
jgi:hypothetical protein